MAANYPLADPSFVSIVDGVDYPQAADLNVVYEEVTAIGAALRGSLAHDVTLATGKKVVTEAAKFPAVQVPSADANTLDDYEEGSWTPTLTGSGGQSGQAYTTQFGRYVKVGKLVTCWGRLTLSALGTVTTNAQIGGLPFTAEDVTHLYGDCHINYWANLTTALIHFSGQVVFNTTSITLLKAAAAATGIGTVVQGDLSNTTDIIFKVTYQASA